jgi:hypothetical protein
MGQTCACYGLGYDAKAREEGADFDACLASVRQGWTLHHVISQLEHQLMTASSMSM